MPSQFTGKAWRERIGSLTCALVQGDEQPPKSVVLMCHGFGAPGDDLVSLALELMHIRPKLKQGVLFVFPEAPLSLESLGMFGARAWWMLDMERLMGIQRGDVSGVKRMRTEIPRGLVEARTALRETLEQLLDKTKVPLSRVVLGGFSQGSMITTDLCIRLPQSPAALVVFSGTLICEDDWKRLAPNRAGLPVVQSHGRQDPILPYAYAEDLRALLDASGLKVDFTAFDGGHTIVLEALEKLAEVVESTVP